MFRKLRTRTEGINWRKKLFVNNISLILSDKCKLILNTISSIERTNKIIKILVIMQVF